MLLLLTGFLYANYNWFFNGAFGKDEWRDLAAFLRPRLAADELVVLVSGHAWPVWEYYAADLPTVRLPELEILDVDAVLDFANTGPALKAAFAEETGKHGAWLVSWQDEVVDPNGVVATQLELGGREKGQSFPFYGLTLQRFSGLRAKHFQNSPPIEQPVDISFGGAITLRGYKVVDNGDLLLFWASPPGAAAPAADLHFALESFTGDGKPLAHPPDRRLAGYNYPYCALARRCGRQPVVCRLPPGWAITRSQGAIVFRCESMARLRPVRPCRRLMDGLKWTLGPWTLRLIEHAGDKAMQQARKLVNQIWLGIAVLLLAGCGELAWTAGPLLYDASFSSASITPNADGDNDATEIRYSLRRPAQVSISFVDAAGKTYYFREARRRAAGDYSVLWGGVVDQPETVATSYGPMEVLSRVLPDGEYTWVIEAVDDQGEPGSATGAITLQDGATTLPELHNFEVVPDVFRPNQDGLRDDWVSISYYLNKDVNDVVVFVEDPAQPGVRFFIAEEPSVAKPNEQGFHEYRYEGGVDLNAEPPPDGLYNIVGEARDAAGNAVRVQRPITIVEGGKPRADVAQGEIDWVGEVNRVVSVPLGESLCFTAVVTNESAVPIRTTGPWPGQEYRFSENYNALAGQGNEAWFQQAGVWRFGINFDTTGIDFPFRWAIGRPEDLEKRIIDGREQWYLLPGKSGQVSGCIVMDEKPPAGTTFWWGGLIHEFVSVANNYIDRITVDVGAP